MRKTIVSILSLLALALVANAKSSINYSYYHGSENTDVWGTGKAETYNIAIRIDDASLVGKAVKAITIPVVTDAANATDYAAFLTRELKVSGGKAVADIASVSFEPAGQWTTVTFSEPYVIEEGGFYAGYTFKVASASETADKTPVLLMVGNNPDGLYIATSRTYRKWAEKASSINGNCPLSVEIEGDFKENACGVVSVSDMRAKAGEAFTVNAVIANYGTSPVTDVTYKYTLDNGTERKVYEKSLTLPEPLGTDFYGATADLGIDIPAEISTKGVYKGTLEITGINGVANPEAAIKGENTVKMISFVPVKRPVMEEFTGTWCGYCPRGWVAMKLMNESYPDRFIAVSYHNADVMQIHSGSSSDPYPVAVNGFPYANLDRVHGTDPYLGDTGVDMGIESVWKARCGVETPVDISAEASLSDDDVISATATVAFAEDIADAPYRMAYMVTADGLAGEEDVWLQSNYFSGDTSYGPQMDMFAQAGSEIMLTYDDVLVANSEYTGVEGSLPASVSDGQEVTHSYRFALGDMVSNYGNKVSLVQDKNRLNVIALVVNYVTGEIENAVKCHVKTATAIGRTVIDNVPKTVESTCLYDISGRKLSSVPENGIYIKAVKYTDGTTEIHKIRK